MRVFLAKSHSSVACDLSCYSYISKKCWILPHGFPTYHYSAPAECRSWNVNSFRVCGWCCHSCIHDWDWWQDCWYSWKRTLRELVKNENSAHRAGKSEPMDTPGGSRERRLGISQVTDILRWRKQIWDTATHWNCQEFFHLFWEEHLEFPDMHGHQGAPIQDLHTTIPAIWTWNMDTPGGSRERRLGISQVTDILRWRKQMWDTATSKAPQCFQHLVPVEELMHSIYQAHY